jgi:hypothetical protein
MVYAGISPETVARYAEALSVLSEFCMNVHDLEATPRGGLCQYLRHGFFYTVQIDIHRQIM